MADMLDAPRNLRALALQILSTENPVELGIAEFTKLGHEADELVVPGRTARTIGQMFGGRRVETLSGSGGQIAIEEAIFGEMAREVHVARPPRRARSFRAARKRCTRTVDSFKPVMALTSRGVQSP